MSLGGGGAGNSSLLELGCMRDMVMHADLNMHALADPAEERDRN